MSYADVFGGGSINPAQRTYIPLTISADVVLQWPIEQQIGGDEVAVDIIDLDATVPGLNVDYNDARQVSTGFTSLFNNVGANTATIRDSAGGTIISLAPGESWFIYLTDNSTAAGVWRTFQLGATVTVAVASALAGAGLKAIATTLNQTMPPTSTAITPINWTDSDRARLTIWTGAAGVLNLPSPAAIGADWFAIIRNEGSGDLTVTPPSGTINSQATLAMAPLDSAMIVTDGTNFFTIGLGPQGAAFFDFVAIAVPGSGDFVLSGVQLNRISYRFTGALTGDRSIIVPTAVQQYWIDNRTTGAFSLFVKTVAQVTPVEVLQNNSNILYCDGVDVVNAESGAVTIPLPVAQGGTGAVTAATARVNLGAAASSLNLIAGDGIFGGGLLTTDRTFAFDLAGITVAAPAPGDFLVFQDIDDSDFNRKATITDIVTAGIGEVSQLIIGGNVRADAQALGILQLRSAGNVDAEPRFLEYAHQDGTPVGLVGQPSASIDFRIANLIVGGDIIAVPGAPGGEFIVDINGVPALRVTNARTQFQGTLDNNAQVFWNDTGGLNRASLGFFSSDAFLFQNQLSNPGVAFRFQGEDSGTIIRTMLEMNPNTGPTLFESGVAVARVLPAASGGFEADNQSTGGGFERVLTTSDLVGGGGFTFAAFKPANTSRSSVAVPFDDPDLVITGIPAGTYYFDIIHVFGASITAAMGIRYRYDFSGTLVNSRLVSISKVNGVNAPQVPASGGDGIHAINLTRFAPTITIITENDWVHHTGTFTVSTSGTLAYQWSQNVSNVNALTVSQHSYMILQRIA